MLTERITVLLLVALISTLPNVTFCASPEGSETEKQEYRQERERIKAMERSFMPGPTNDLEKYEKYADELQKKWKEKNKELYARLMLEVCGPISSGRFNGEHRQHELARKYALSVLAEPNAIPLETELELTGFVMTSMIGPNAPQGQKWQQIRAKDVEIRLHAWRRLADAIDPNWDPNDLPQINIAPPGGTIYSSGVAPEAIKDPILRAQYESALEANRKKIERYSEQNSLNKWLKRFPKKAEEYIVGAYSVTPYNLEELQKYLDRYIADSETRKRIVDSVVQNIVAKRMKELEETKPK